MGLRCDDVLRDISSYVDGDLAPGQRLEMDSHFAECPRCKSVLDGMRNVVLLYGDEKLVSLPPGFQPRLRSRLADQVEGQKGSVIGWVVGAAAFGALAASILLTTARQEFAPRLQAQMSQPARKMPEQLVAVVDGGKTFHRPGCTFMHGKYHMVTAEEAVREGYTPCVRCMSAALGDTGHAEAAPGPDELESNALGPR